MVRVVIRPIRSTDWLEMAGGMSDLQRKALLALTSDDTPTAALVRLGATSPIGAAFERDGELIAVAGAVIAHPGVASTFRYATEDFRRVILEVTHYFKDTLFPALKALGVHRVHSLGPANDPGGHRWQQKSLGARPEAHLEKFGKNGEDFVLHSIML